MSTVVAITYPEGAAAGEAAATLKQMQTKFLIDLEDIAWVTKDTDGTLKRHQGTSLSGGSVNGGAFWVFLAAEGKWINAVSNAIPLSGSALLVLARNANAERALPEMAKFGGTLIKTDLSVQ
jgi:uncharacterized membrane protein